MSCQDFARQTAVAFNQVFDLGAVYGATALFVGVVVGFVIGRFICRHSVTG